MNTRVNQILFDGKTVKGVELEADRKFSPNDLPDMETIEAPVVICTLPVWNIFDVMEPDVLPSWYADQIMNMARPENKACWIGFYAASDEPVYALSEKELTAWFKAPRTGFAGFSFSCSFMDPSVAPDGKHLFVCGGVCLEENLRSKRMVKQPPGACTGSMFKNPQGDYAGRLIEKAGLKGTKIGDVEISKKHGNFFINNGSGTADDFMELIRLTRNAVADQFGIQLELEVELLGDWEL